MNRVLSAILPYFEFALQFAPLFFRALPRPRLGATLGSLAVTINVKPLGTLTAFPVGFICGAVGGMPNINGDDERSRGQWGNLPVYKKVAYGCMQNAYKFWCM